MERRCSNCKWWIVNRKNQFEGSCVCRATGEVIDEDWEDVFDEYEQTSNDYVCKEHEYDYGLNGER